jgi:hypothetical protein
MVVWSAYSSHWKGSFELLRIVKLPTDGNDVSRSLDDDKLFLAKMVDDWQLEFEENASPQQIHQVEGASLP